MKQVMNITIGKKSFNLEADAYLALKEYLETFRYKSSAGVQTEETMQDIEERIAEILYSKTASVRNVVTLEMIDEITDQLGLPDGKRYSRSGQSNTAQSGSGASAVKRLFRDTDNNVIGGVCSGFGHYFNTDPVLVRIVFILLVLAGFSGIMAYIVLLIVVPAANTSAQKCEMRGWPLTAENIEKVTRNI